MDRVANRSVTIDRIVNSIGWAVAAALAATHLYFLIKFKIDLPIADEWSDFAPRRGMDRELTWQWIFATTNSHPLVGQRLLSWIFLIADGRDYKTQAIAQFAIFVPSLFWLLNKCERGLRVSLGWLAALMFTALHAANYYWPFMFFLYIHFLSTLGAIYLITSARRGANICGYALGAFSALQAGPGIATRAALAVVGPMLGSRFTGRSPRIHWAGSALIVMTIALWLALAHRDNPFVLENAPWTPQYWGFIATALASAAGVGFPRVDPRWLGWACVFGSVLLIAALFLSAHLWFWDKRRRLYESRLARFAIAWFLVAISALLLVALGRPWQTGFWVLRYHVISLPVLMAIILMAIAMLQNEPTARWRPLAVPLLVLGVLAWYVPNMNPASHYERHGSQAIAQLNCARAFFVSERTDSCDEGPYTWGIEQGHIRTARAVRANFCRSVAPSVSRYADLEECYLLIDRPVSVIR
jgi:hypothetical protein